MGVFLRETSQKKVITEDKISLSGVMTAGTAETIPALTLVAFDIATGKWVKYVEATHLRKMTLGILKEDATTEVAADSPAVGILIQGVVSKADVNGAVFVTKVIDALMSQGLFVL